MTDTPQILLAHHLKALKLPTFLREYDKLARQCAAEGLDHGLGGEPAAAEVVGGDVAHDLAGDNLGGLAVLPPAKRQLLMMLPFGRSMTMRRCWPLLRVNSLNCRTPPVVAVPMSRPAAAIISKVRRGGSMPGASRGVSTSVPVKDSARLLVDPVQALYDGRVARGELAATALSDRLAELRTEYDQTIEEIAAAGADEQHRKRLAILVEHDAVAETRRGGALGVVSLLRRSLRCGHLGPSRCTGWWGAHCGGTRMWSRRVLSTTK